MGDGRRLMPTIGSQTIQEYEKGHLNGLTIAEQITQLMHDYDNGCGMHNFKKCDLYEKGTWKVGRWKDKLQEVEYLISKHNAALLAKHEDEIRQKAYREVVASHPRFSELQKQWDEELVEGLVIAEKGDKVLSPDEYDGGIIVWAARIYRARAAIKSAREAKGKEGRG